MKTHYVSRYLLFRKVSMQTKHTEICRYTQDHPTIFLEQSSRIVTQRLNLAQSLHIQCRIFLPLIGYSLLPRLHFIAGIQSFKSIQNNSCEWGEVINTSKMLILSSEPPVEGMGCCWPCRYFTELKKSSVSF